MVTDQLTRITLYPEDIRKASKGVPFDKLTLSDFNTPDMHVFYQASIVVFTDGKEYRRDLKQRWSEPVEERNPHAMHDMDFRSESDSLGIHLPRPLCVVCVAIRLDDYTVLTAPRPARHHHLTSAWHFKTGGKLSSKDGCVQGFMLSDGTFADRERAGRVAMAAGQIKEHRHKEPKLYTEDIW